jgi:hypothetical protein
MTHTHTKYEYIPMARRNLGRPWKRWNKPEMAFAILLLLYCTFSDINKSILSYV